MSALRGLLLLLTLVPACAWGFYGKLRIDEIFSNADGSVQFVTILDPGIDSCNSMGDRWAGAALISVGGGTQVTYVFPTNLPTCATSGKNILIATESFAALHIVTPDYVVPDHFLRIPDGTLFFPSGSTVTYTALPHDGVTAILASGTPVPNLATNLAGDSGSVQVQPPAAVNYQGLWYKAPAESESGWGINFAHQGDIIFATWFTYDSAGKAWWLTMTATKTAEGVYTGQLMRTNGTPFSAFVPPVTATVVGTGTLTFTSATAGTFSYTVNDGANVATQTKAIVPQAFATVPTCVWGAQPDLTQATNYQDLWYKAPAESEAGWGVNLTHQGTTIFATWFTYDANHNPLWLSGVMAQTAPKTYTGSLLLTGGQAFSAVPFDPTKITRTTVGTATFTFTNGNAGTFSYNVDLGDGVNKATQTKSITRQVFRTPGTVCN